VQAVKHNTRQSAPESNIVAKERHSKALIPWKDKKSTIYRLRTAYFSRPEKIFAGVELTRYFYAVIIVGFALESGDFCPAEALQVVCSVDDGPKTDWLVVC
jgi:hypothetical protein